MSEYTLKPTRAEYDMTKKIVMGPYYKYDENDDWCSNYCSAIGEVRVIEGVLCYAEQDIEFLNVEPYDPSAESSKKVVRWIPYDMSE